MSKSSSSKDQAKAQIVGHLDYIADGYAYGWAFNPMKPHESVSVDILCDGVIVGHGPAKAYRQDLKDAGIGDGNHLFKIKLSYELYNGETHNIYAKNTSNNILLTGSNILLSPEKNAFPFPLISRNEGASHLQNLCQPLAKTHSNEKIEKINHAYQIGSLLQETGETEDARYAWNSLAKVLGENAFCFCKIAETYLLEENPKLALEFFKRAIEQNLTFTWAHIGMSVSYALMQNFEYAEESLDFATSLASKTPQYSNQLMAVKLSLLPKKVEKLLIKNRDTEALDILFPYILENPHQDYALEQIKEIIGKEVNFAVSKSTNIILISHHQSLRLLEMTMCSLLRDVNGKSESNNAPLQEEKNV